MDCVGENAAGWIAACWQKVASELRSRGVRPHYAHVTVGNNSVKGSDPITYMLRMVMIL